MSSETCQDCQLADRAAILKKGMASKMSFLAYKYVLLGFGNKVSDWKLQQIKFYIKLRQCTFSRLMVSELWKLLIKLSPEYRLYLFIICYGNCWSN